MAAKIHKNPSKDLIVKLYKEGSKKTDGTGIFWVATKDKNLYIFQDYYNGKPNDDPYAMLEKEGIDVNDAGIKQGEGVVTAEGLICDDGDYSEGNMRPPKWAKDKYFTAKTTMQGYDPTKSPVKEQTNLAHDLATKFADITSGKLEEALPSNIKGSTNDIANNRADLAEIKELAKNVIKGINELVSKHPSSHDGFKTNLRDFLGGTLDAIDRSF